MYSKQHACNFIHQRKAAGSSIKTLFADAEPISTTGTLELFNSLFATDVAFWGYDFEAGPGVPPGRCLIENAGEVQVPREAE